MLSVLSLKSLARSRSAPSVPPRRFRPRVEALEDRTVPSGSPPTVLISGAGQSPEGQSYLLNLTAVDPEGDPVSGWTVNWGDGNIQTLGGNPSTVRHTYAAGPNAYNITASAVVDGVTYAANVADAGRFLDVFVGPGTGGLDFPRWMTFGPDGNLYVSNGGTRSVLRYDGATGAFLGEFVAAGSGGLDNPYGINALAFGPDGNLYVGDWSYVGDSTPGAVRRYDGTTGAFLDVFVSPGSGGLIDTSGLTFGPDGHLYVSDSNGRTRRYDGQTGEFLGLFSSSAGSDTGSATQFGPDGHLYVNDGAGARVQRYNGATGAFLDTFIPSFYGNTNRPYGMTFGPDGDFYLASSLFPTADSTFNRVVRFDPATGELVDVFAAGPEQDGPFTVTFGPDGNLYVSNMYNDSILRYTGPLTAGASTQLPITVLDVSTYGNTTRKNIPAQGTVLSTITVPNSFTVADVNVTLDVTHSWDSDLNVYLISPAGTRVELFTRVGGSGDNFKNTTVDDEARLPFNSGSAPFTGVFYPEGRGAGRLSAFDGQGAGGTWTLEIADVVKGNSGKLNSWRLDLARAASAIRAESAGPGDSTDPLTADLVAPVLAEAVSRWNAAGADVSGLTAPSVQITDLGGTTLALVSDNTIWLDVNAAGWGWFADATPWDDSEFSAPGDQGRMDLLTVLSHELGHLLGLDHDDGGVMAETLAPGVRLTPTPAPPGSVNALDRVFALDRDGDDWTALALALANEQSRKK